MAGHRAGVAQTEIEIAVTIDVAEVGLADREAVAQAAAADPMLLATDLAEALVREGVPFREAHEAVGRVVAHCVEKPADLRALSREELRAFHPAFPGDAAALTDLGRALEERSLMGGTARSVVSAALAEARARTQREAAALDASAGVA